MSLLVEDAAPGAPADEPAAAPRRVRARLADAALTVAAVLGLVVLGLTVTAHWTGLRPLVVRSGSMEPTIATGGMVLVRTVPAADIRVGDVVTVDRPDGVRVTHRVVEVDHDGATAEVVLKGDANEDVDPLPIVVEEVGRLVRSAPALGRAAALLATAPGGFVLGCLVTVVLSTVLRRRAD